MPKVTFFEPQRHPHDVDASAGLSLMRAAVDHDVAGIDADCGGACALRHLPRLRRTATGLDAAGAIAPHGGSACSTLRPSAQDDSRLACQIALTDALDGLTVSLPLGQH